MGMAKKRRRTPARLSKWQKAELNRRERERDSEAPAVYDTYQRSVSAPDGEWQVRHIRGGSSEKEYTCPGCHQTIQIGQAHLVSWREDHIFGVEYGANERRHWHTKCWESRNFRYR